MERGTVYCVYAFLERYSAFIDKIREIHPDALIYIESIMPVTKEKSESE